MKREMQDLAQWALDTAKKAGADDCGVGIGRERFVEISYRDKKPESIKEASRRGLSVDIYVNNRFSSQSTSDLRKKSLHDFITNAVATTGLLAEDPYRSLPDPKYYQGRAEIDLQIADPSHDAFTPEQRHELVRTVEDASLDAGGKKVISVTAMEYDSHGESVALTSNGFEGGRETTTYWIGADMTIKDKGDRRPNGWEYVGSRNRKGLLAPDKVGRAAAQRTLDLLGAKKLKTETLPIIVENRSVSRIGRGFIEAMFGRSIQQKRSFLADKKGAQVGSARMTLIDSPLLVGGLESRLYDSDGFATKTRTMIEAGVLKDFYVDWYYSRKLGWEPTTGTPSNLTIPPGNRSIKEIMKDLGRGILITGFLGGNSNSTTGDFSIGVLGHLFENGQPVQAIAEMNIADNHLTFWNKLAEVANDPWLHGAARTPSLVFTDVVVSGA